MNKSIPKPIRNAMDAWAYLYWQNDQGYGSGPSRAQKAYDAAEKKLLSYLKRNLKMEKKS